MQQLSQVQLNLRKSLSELEEYYVYSSTKRNVSMQNNQIIRPKLIKLMSGSLQTMEIMLQMLTDNDIMILASTCHTFYKIIYSPLGFRMCRHLRPIVVLKTNKQYDEIVPTFTQNTVDQLCSDRSLQNVDQDDKHAILLTMRTNILATKQKIRELDLLIEHYDYQTQGMKGKIMYLGGQREEYYRKCLQVQQQVQKLRQVMKQTEGHAYSLKQQQQKILLERHTKQLVLNEEKGKLTRQKQLLIKKIKSQQKQKQQGLIYARQVDRILGRLNQITSTGTAAGKKKSSDQND